MTKNEIGFRAPVTSDECVTVDLFGYTFPCEPQPDPCMVGGFTLYSVIPCSADNPPLDVWCQSWPAHPVCAAPQLPELPETGADVSFGAGWFVLVGVVLVRLAKRPASRGQSCEHGALNVAVTAGGRTQPGARVR